MGMINQVPTKEYKLDGCNKLRLINVATCHGMSYLGFHPHLVLRSSMKIFPKNIIK
jgi:hypothetical protein